MTFPKTSEKKRKKTSHPKTNDVSPLRSTVKENESDRTLFMPVSGEKSSDEAKRPFAGLLVPTADGEANR